MMRSQMLHCIRHAQNGNSQETKTRRTTLTLPSDTLACAERIARIRKVTLSSVIAEALADGLRIWQATERSEEVLKSYRRAFEGFSEQEMLLLDGVLLERPQRRPDWTQAPRVG